MNAGLLFSSAATDWLTPPEVVDAVVQVLGHIDLDPCADAAHGIPATLWYTEAVDGLAHAWVGRVYLNPPYGTQIPRWIAKLQDEVAVGRVTEAIALLPARTDTRWFPWGADRLCFVRGRLHFSGHGGSAPFPSAIAYWGDRGKAFERVFCTWGAVVKESLPLRKPQMVALESPEPRE